MLKDICPHDECTGCMACYNICAHEAITLLTDNLGFKYPKINAELCVQCNLCSKICPQLHPLHFHSPKQCYAGAINNTEILNCSSGGVAFALSKAIINRNGLVVGCSGANIRDVHHTIVSTEDNLVDLKGSKYVQSRISESLLKNIRKELQNGREILFIGTGCQIAGLYNYLNRPYDTLYTIDLVCHGVPSQQMLNDNIDNYSNIKPESIKFRHKIKTNGKYSIRYGWFYRDKNSNTLNNRPWHKDPYLSAFMSSINFRKACYSCQYAQNKRIGDITIGDFWGLSSDSKLNNSSGVSLILVNTYRGQQLIGYAKDYLIVEERTIKEAVDGNPQLQHPSICPRNRAKFEKLYVTRGLKIASQKTIMPKMLMHRILTSLKARIERLI